ncbi:MAG: hypothetical protein N5P05_004654 (plasmid) [Chroococcopsis gigantea SAG 12.99]|nr:hypothetical protein [Chroococcopsis gigantea SAG 12.99]
MKRWVWQSLTGEIKRVLPDLLGDDYQYLVADGANNQGLYPRFVLASLPANRIALGLISWR